MLDLFNRMIHECVVSTPTPFRRIICSFSCTQCTCRSYLVPTNRVLIGYAACSPAPRDAPLSLSLSPPPCPLLPHSCLTSALQTILMIPPRTAFWPFLAATRVMTFSMWFHLFCLPHPFYTAFAYTTQIGSLLVLIERDFYLAQRRRLFDSHSSLNPSWMGGNLINFHHNSLTGTMAHFQIKFEFEFISSGNIFINSSADLRIFVYILLQLLNWLWYHL